MSDQVTWNALKNSVYLQILTYGPTAKNIRMLEMILHEEAFNLFGVIKKEMNIRKPSRHLKHVKDILSKIKNLVNAMKSCSDENKYGMLVCLKDELKKRRQVFRSAEHSRKRRWCRKQLQHCFFKDPFKTAKEVITPKVKSEPKVPKSVFNEFIQKAASDQDKTVPLGDLDGLDDISINIHKFNSEKFKISKLSQMAKKKRNASQLGLNQIL